MCASGNGTIEFNEFLAMMNRTVKHVNVEQEMRQAFKDYVVLSPDREHTVPLFYNKVAPQVFQILEDTLK